MNSIPLEEKLNKQLQRKRTQQLQRVRQVIHTPQQINVRQGNEMLLSFNSNDYLGLANHPDLIYALQQGAAEYGVGSGASALLGGYSRAHQRCEEAASAFLKRDRALLFSSGQLANMAVLSTLVKRQDCVWHDKDNHASLLDGSRLSRSRLKRYRHLDLAHLEQGLQRHTQHSQWLVSESVFSMSGDLAPLDQLATLAHTYQANLLVDDAHGFGCLGPQGRGSVAQFSLSQQQVPLLMVTLGKACGVSGAIVAGTDACIETLIQQARPYIYTTMMSPAVAVAATEALGLVERADHLRAQLQANINYFKHAAKQLALALVPSDTAIQAVLLYDKARALQAEQYLRKQGLWVRAIRPPTVVEGRARLRVSLTAQHTRAHLDQLLEALCRL